MGVAKGTWKSREQQLKFFEKAAKHFNIQTPSDWGSISAKEFAKIGGKSILYHHQWSIFRALKNIYPGTHFCFN